MLSPPLLSLATALTLVVSLLAAPTDQRHRHLPPAFLLAGDSTTHIGSGV
jgi:hypothetical protein